MLAEASVTFLSVPWSAGERSHPAAVEAAWRGETYSRRWLDLRGTPVQSWRSPTTCSTSGRRQRRGPAPPGRREPRRSSWVRSWGLQLLWVVPQFQSVVFRAQPAASSTKVPEPEAAPQWPAAEAETAGAASAGGRQQAWVPRSLSGYWHPRSCSHLSSARRHTDAARPRCLVDWAGRTLLRRGRRRREREAVGCQGGSLLESDALLFTSTHTRIYSLASFASFMA